ncbi:MAG: hypothetical protein RL095_444 [Verrucomicrobiota bacterium]|jgi:hypothetical protein
MRLNENEQQALKEWLKHRSYRDAAAQLGVNFTSIGRWLNGSGMHPAQYDTLIKQLQPYLASSPTPSAPIRPSLRECYERLCALEDNQAPMLPLILHSIKTCPLGDGPSSQSPKSSLH